MTTPNDPGQPPPPPYGQQPPGYVPAPAYGAPTYGSPAGNPYPPYGQQQPAYGGTGYGQPVRNGMGVAALVLGILSIPFAFLFVGGVLAVLAIVFGFVGRGRVKRNEATNPGVALAGIITGILGALLLAGWITAIALLANSGSVKQLNACNDRAITQADRDQCAHDFGKHLFGN